MADFSLFERVISNLKEIMNPYLGPIRRKKLNNLDFTIISNNCWGGVCYEYFHLPKNSPTVGVYFYPDDYLKFIINLRYYLGLEIEMITSEESKHYHQMKQRGEIDVPVGRIGDIEIVFLHYKDQVIAKEKWERRKKRVNWDNIIIKFSYMNGCTDEHIHEFETIKDVKKFALVPHEFPDYPDCKLATYAVKNGQITNDTFYFNKDIDVIGLINKEKTSYR